MVIYQKQNLIISNQKKDKKGKGNNSKLNGYTLGKFIKHKIHQEIHLDGFFYAHFWTKILEENIPLTKIMTTIEL